MKTLLLVAFVAALVGLVISTYVLVKLLFNKKSTNPSYKKNWLVE